MKIKGTIEFSTEVTGLWIPNLQNIGKRIRSELIVMVWERRGLSGNGFRVVGSYFRGSLPIFCKIVLPSYSCQPCFANG